MKTQNLLKIANIGYVDTDRSENLHALDTWQIIVCQNMADYCGRLLFAKT